MRARTSTIDGQPDPMDPRPADSGVPTLDDRWDPEPRWPALIAVLAVGGLSLALPPYLTMGPPWLFPAIAGALMVPTVISHRAGKHHLDRIFGLITTGWVTLGLVAAVVLLIRALPQHKESPTALLLSATSVWFTNILVFALWYWRLDAGGPHGREQERRRRFLVLG